MRDLLPEEMNTVSGACAPCRPAPCDSQGHGHGQQEPTLEVNVNPVLDGLSSLLSHLL